MVCVVTVHELCPAKEQTGFAFGGTTRVKGQCFFSHFDPFAAPVGQRHLLLFFRVDSRWHYQ